MKIIVVFICISSGLLVAYSIASAHTGKNMPKPFLQRHALMGSFAAHTKSIKGYIASNNVKAVASPAEAIYWLAKILPDTFPKGSGLEMGKTRALSKIWSDWESFVASSGDLADAAASLKAAAEIGDLNATENAFRAMGRNGCGDCHKTFRGPKQ